MYYVRGLLKKIAIKFYAMDIDIQITHQGFTGDVMLVVYRCEIVAKTAFLFFVFT